MTMCLCGFLYHRVRVHIPYAVELVMLVAKIEVEVGHKNGHNPTMVSIQHGSLHIQSALLLCEACSPLSFGYPVKLRTCSCATQLHLLREQQVKAI